MYLSVIFCAIVFTNVCDSVKHQLNYDYYKEYYDEYDYKEYIKLNHRHKNPNKVIARYYTSHNEEVPDESDAKPVRATTINYFGPDMLDPNIGYYKFPASPMVKFKERIGVGPGSGKVTGVGKWIGLPFRIAKRVTGLIRG